MHTCCGLLAVWQDCGVVTMCTCLSLLGATRSQAVHETMQICRPEEMHRIMTQMKQLIKYQPMEASVLLQDNPQLVYALFKAQQRMGMLDEATEKRLLGGAGGPVMAGNKEPLPGPAAMQRNAPAVVRPGPGPGGGPMHEAGPPVIRGSSPFGEPGPHGGGPHRPGPARGGPGGGPHRPGPRHAHDPHNPHGNTKMMPGPGFGRAGVRARVFTSPPLAPVSAAAGQATLPRQNNASNAWARAWEGKRREKENSRSKDLTLARATLLPPVLPLPPPPAPLTPLACLVCLLYLCGGSRRTANTAQGLKHAVCQAAVAPSCLLPACATTAHSWVSRCRAARLRATLVLSAATWAPVQGHTGGTLPARGP